MFNYIIKYKSNVNFDLFFLSVFMFIFVLAGCDTNDDPADDPNDFTGVSETYNIEAVDDSGISGVALFEERTDGSTLVTVQLDGTEPGISYPVNILENSVVEEGSDNAFTLNNVDGETGRSETEISDYNGTAFTYNEFTEFDGHIVGYGGENGDEIVGHGDIGGNRLTGNSVTYNLDEVDESGVSGTVVFEERQNQNTLATVQLDGTIEGGDHPVNLNHGAVGAGGEASIPFTNVEGATGTSATNIRADQTTDNFNYGAVEGYDGHVGVQTSAGDQTAIAEGNIGANFANGGGGGEGI